MWNFNLLTRIYFGTGMLSEIGTLVKDQFNSSRVLVITDQGMQQTETISKLTKQLSKKSIDYFLFDSIEGEPDENVVYEACHFLKKNMCDLVVGIGGGSSIDTAKLCAIRANNEEPLIQYEGMNKYPHSPLPVIAVPTTAGTGSEVSQSAIVTERKTNRKISIRGSSNAPKIALLDPGLLSTIPFKVAAAAGMDALAHAIEAFQSTQATPLSTLFAERAISLLTKNIRPFAYNPTNIQAAEHMLLGSLCAGVAFSNGRVGITHAMALPLGSRFGIPHGVACAIMTPMGARFSWKGNPEKFASLAKLLGCHTSALTQEEAAQASITALEKLSEDLKIPADFKQWDIPSALIPQMAEEVIEAKIHVTNCRKVTYEDVVHLYKEVIPDLAS